jgi:hypothetical protein
VVHGLQVVAVGVEHEGAVVAGVVLRAQAGAPLSVPPASSAAAWKASTAARSSARSATWATVGVSDWASQKSGKRVPMPTTPGAGSMTTW